MKKIFALMLSLPLIMGMYSCSDDDDDNDNIVGKWELVEVYGDVEANPEALKKDLAEGLKESPESYESTILEFKKDGKGTSTYTYKNEVETEDFTYSIKGDRLTITYHYIEEGETGEDVEFDGTFSFNNGNLVAKQDVLNEYKYMEKDYPEGKISKALEISVFKRK